MIKIVLRNREKETALVDLLQGESVTGSMFVNFPIKGMTRKDRRTGLYKVVNSNA